MTHIQMTCTRYGYQLNDSVAMTCVEHFHKDRKLTSEDARKMSERTRHILPVAALSWATEDTDDTRNVEKPMKYLGLAPSDAWPDKIREDAPWSKSVLYRLRKLYPDCSACKILPGENRPNDFDIIACYRTDTPEYLEALQRQIIQYLSLGVPVEQCLDRLSQHGFLGELRSGVIGDGRHKPYLIPEVAGIDPRLWNTTKWHKAGVDGLRALGVNPDEHRKSLKEVMERLLAKKHSGAENVSKFVCDHYRHLWLQRPEIKLRHKLPQTLLGQIPDEIKGQLALQKTDKLNLMGTKLPDWKNQFMKVIFSYLQEGHTNRNAEPMT